MAARTVSRRVSCQRIRVCDFGRALCGSGSHISGGSGRSAFPDHRRSRLLDRRRFRRRAPASAARVRDERKAFAQPAKGTALAWTEIAEN